MVRRILGTVAGVAVAVVVVTLVEGAGHLIYPPRAGTDISDPEALAATMQSMQTGAKVAVVLAWFAGSLAGALTALKITSWRWSGWIVAAFIVAGGIYSMLTISHPPWMIATGIILPLLAAGIAGRLSK
jgi:hypothetical protein